MKINKKVIFDFLLDYFIFVIVFCTIAIFVLFFFPFTSHAAVQSGPQFPILVDNIDVSPYQDWINNRYGGYWNLSQDNVIGWGSQESGYYVQTFAIPQVPSQVVGYFSITPFDIEYDYPDYDYGNNTITLTFTNLANDNNRPWRLITFYTNGNNGPGYPYGDAFNTANTINKGVYGHTGATLNYVSSNIYFPKNNAWQEDLPIFVNEIPVVPLPDTDTYPNDAPQPDIDDYIPDWGNTPTFDGSTVENALSSIYNFLSWFSGNWKDTLKGLFKFIGDDISWGFQKILNSLDRFKEKLEEVATDLQDAIEDFVDTVSGYLEQILDYFDYITEPISPSDINNAWTATNTYGIANSFESTFTTFESAFDISEPETFTLTIHIENIRTFYNFGCYSPVVIHLDSHFTPIKAALRTFLWVLVSFGTVFVIDKGLANWLRGERNT